MNKFHHFLIVSRFIFQFTGDQSRENPNGEKINETPPAPANASADMRNVSDQLAQAEELNDPNVKKYRSIYEEVKGIIDSFSDSALMEKLSSLVNERLNLSKDNGSAERYIQELAKKNVSSLPEMIARKFLEINGISEDQALIAEEKYMKARKFVSETIPASSRTDAGVVTFEESEIIESKADAGQKGIDAGASADAGNRDAGVVDFRGEEEIVEAKGFSINPEAVFLYETVYTTLKDIDHSNPKQFYADVDQYVQDVGFDGIKLSGEELSIYQMGNLNFQLNQDRYIQALTRMIVGKKFPEPNIGAKAENSFFGKTD